MQVSAPIQLEPQPYRFEAPQPDGERVWIFGYGSLMWNPGFEAVDAEPGMVRGYHRDIVIRSLQYRGTAVDPGLVFGLDRGGACRGTAIAARLSEWKDVHLYLHDREMAGDAYTPRWLDVRLTNGRHIKAYTYVVNRNGRAYERVDYDTALARIRRCSGRNGSNRDYVLNTVDHLHELGIRDRKLDRLARDLRAATAEPSAQTNS